MTSRIQKNKSDQSDSTELVDTSRNLYYDDSTHLESQSLTRKCSSISNYYPLSSFHGTFQAEDSSSSSLESESDLVYEPTSPQEKVSNIDNEACSFYQQGQSVAYPKSLKTRTITDLAPMNTIFDLQFSQGDFFLPTEQPISYSSTLTTFTTDLLACLQLRDKYQSLSCQISHLNPVNFDSWESFPPDLPKYWHYEDEYGIEAKEAEGDNSYYYDERKVRHYYGETFNMEDYETFYRSRNNQNFKETSKVYFDKKRHTYKFSNFDDKFSLQIPRFSEYFQDLHKISNLSNDPIGLSLTSRRLSYLEAKFEQYQLLNDSKENELTKLNPHRDFYNVRKIDNNIDLSMSMSRKALVNVINDKLKKEPERVVYVEGDVSLTLSQLFEPYLLQQDIEEDDGKNENKKKKAPRLNIDDIFEFGIIDRNFETLDRKSKDDSSTTTNKALVRIDRTFLRMDNHIGGEYLADLVKQVFSDYERTKYQFGELGLNFNLIPNNWYHDLNEETEDQINEWICFTRWDSIANWIIDHKLISHNIKWIIRIPRNYSILHQLGRVSNFQDYLDSLFKPLFEISSDPEKNLKLHYFLTKVSAFDLLSGSFNKINDISLFEHRNLKPPSQWKDQANPPYSYYLYYIFLNLTNLNQYRRTKGFNCLCLRNHINSMAEDVDSGLGIITESLASNFLISKSVINAEKLRNYPTLQYLYYLKQIGMTMSPLCWNKRLQILKNDDTTRSSLTNSSYESHPILNFFKAGMKVSLSTNKPLFSSLTRDPLIEEYSIATSIHKLATVDVCELARNSVLISGFNGNLKRHWIGVKYVAEMNEDKSGLMDWIDSDEFAIQRSNVPNMRIKFRKDALRGEFSFIRHVSGG